MASGVGDFEGPSLFFSLVLKIGCYHMCLPLAVSRICMFYLYYFPAGLTPFLFSVHSGDVGVVKYFLDHGGDPMKADAKGCSVLHYAVGTGSSANHTLIKCCITKYFMKVFSIKNLLCYFFNISCTLIVFPFGTLLTKVR